MRGKHGFRPHRPDRYSAFAFRQVSFSPHIKLYLGAILISLSPVWVKLVDVSATTSGFYRVFIGSVVLGIVLLVTRRRFDFDRRVWLILAVAAVFFALDLWFWHRSILFIGPGLATLLANFQVFIMMFVGVVALGQRVEPRHLLAVPLAVLGLVMIVGTGWQTLAEKNQVGILFGLLTACAYAGYMLSLRASRRDATDRLPTREVFVVSTFCALMLGLSGLAEGESLAIGAEDFAWLLCYGVLSHSLGWLLIASSLPHVSTTEAGLALLLQPSLSFVWDVLIFSRAMTATEMLGAGIALFAIYLGSRATRLPSRR